MNQKGFINIIIVAMVVVVLGVIGYFVVIKKTEPVAQIKSDAGVYVDNKLGFSIVPPKGWYTNTKEMPGSSVAFFAKDGGQVVNKEFNSTLAVSTWLDDKSDLEQNVAKIKKVYSGATEEYKPISDNVIVIDGQNARVIESSLTMTINYTTATENCVNCKFKLRKLDVVMADGKGKIYYLAATALESDWAKYKDLIANSQKTFKFVNPAAQTSDSQTANWKTYTNTAFNYSVKYPSDWTIGVKGGADVKTFPAPYFDSPCNYDLGQLCPQIYVETGAYDPNKKLEPDFIINLTGSKPDKVSNTITTSVDGEQAVGFELFEPGSDNNGKLLYVLVTKHNKTKYTFVYQESQKNHTFQTGSDWQDKKTFDQMISTFKFTTPSAAANPAEVKTFTSQKLGIRFNYLASEGDPVIEENNKVYVGGKTGQWVEVFSKDKSLTLAQAIERDFLKGYDSGKCYVEVRNDPKLVNIVKAAISYPPYSGSDPDIPYWENGKYCPPAYSKTNGVTYFYMDKNYSDKYFFFSIGQYAITAEADRAGGGEKTWQDTFEVIK